MTQKSRMSHKEIRGVAGKKPVSRFPSRIEEKPRQKLEIVLKCDSFGTSEAASALLAGFEIPEVAVKVIHSGVGDITKSDLLMALTGSKLVVGFNVGAMPKLDQWAKEHGVEVRVYDVIYKLTEDLRRIAESLAPSKVEAPDEKVVGKAEVVALFKSSHKGVILGCQVVEGVFAVGKRFRIISAMGPVYSGRIESLQIERRSVQNAKAGQQAGLKISDFNKVKLGDFVECFEAVPIKKTPAWKSSGNVLHFVG